MSEAHEASLKAKAASVQMALLSEDQRNDILCAMAQALRESAEEICAANARDMDAARLKGTSEGLLDRLFLDGTRIEGMAKGLEALAKLPDPLGRVLDERELYNGLRLSKVSVPLGVVAMVYEARPNVTADAAGICLKSGNACVLRGGSLAVNSNLALAHVLHEAAVGAGAPRNCIVPIESTDRGETDELLKQHGLVDVLIPRGGAGLIQHCVECAQIPVIETGTGNCHIYLHESADIEKAIPIIINAKTQRTGVCNAAESLLVDASVAETLLPQALLALAEHDVLLHCDDVSLDIARGAGVPEHLLEKATEEDWGTEYLALEMSVTCVSGLDEAIEHINRYGTGHSECIVGEDALAIRKFQMAVDAAAVYANASTRFSDGGEFGLGAEIGISTQKLHVRGPFALEALATYKYLIEGEGQVRA